eukprot:726813-Prymnesium_polylepis.1
MRRYRRRTRSAIRASTCMTPPQRRARRGARSLAFVHLHAACSRRLFTPPPQPRAAAGGRPIRPARAHAAPEIARHTSDGST